MTNKDVFVIDTNVFVVASAIDHKAGTNCVESCINFLEKLDDLNSVILIDWYFDKNTKSYESNILNEYQNNITSQDFAYLFVRKIFDYDPQFERVETLFDQDLSSYPDFPSDIELEKFDASDRKFVAVAISSKKNPEIVNAGDSKSWERYKIQLEKYVRLKFLCKHS